MIHYPLQFNTEASASCGMGTAWTAASSRFENKVAVPPEFEGPGGALSPEDLFAQALASCFIATFKVLAEKSRVTYGQITVTGALTVDRDELKRPVMKKYHLRIQIHGPSDEARARRLADKALETGFILNSVKTEITHEINVSGN